MAPAFQTKQNNASLTEFTRVISCDFCERQQKCKIDPSRLLTAPSNYNVCDLLAAARCPLPSSRAASALALETRWADDTQPAELDFEPTVGAWIAPTVFERLGGLCSPWLWPTERPTLTHLINLVLGVAEYVNQNFVRVFAQKRRAGNFYRRVR